jgi:hypothetical protein
MLLLIMDVRFSVAVTTTGSGSHLLREELRKFYSHIATYQKRRNPDTYSTLLKAVHFLYLERNRSGSVLSENTAVRIR